MENPLKTESKEAGRVLPIVLCVIAIMGVVYVAFSQSTATTGTSGGGGSSAQIAGFTFTGGGVSVSGNTVTIPGGTNATSSAAYWDIPYENSNAVLNGTLVVSNTVTITGNTILGNAAADTITLNGAVTSTNGIIATGPNGSAALGVVGTGGAMWELTSIGGTMYLEGMNRSASYVPIRINGSTLTLQGDTNGLTTVGGALTSVGLGTFSAGINMAGKGITNLQTSAGSLVAGAPISGFPTGFSWDFWDSGGINAGMRIGSSVAGSTTLEIDAFPSATTTRNFALRNNYNISGGLELMISTTTNGQPLTVLHDWQPTLEQSYGPHHFLGSINAPTNSAAYPSFKSTPPNFFSVFTNSARRMKIYASANLFIADNDNAEVALIAYSGTTYTNVFSQKAFIVGTPATGTIVGMTNRVEITGFINPNDVYYWTNKVSGAGAVSLITNGTFGGSAYNEVFE